MAILYYFVGIVGSGKTTYARELYQENDVFLDSDAIRAELLSGEEDQSNNALIFNEMQNRTVAALNRGQNVYYVACNIWSKKRIQFLKTLRQRVKEPFAAHCLIINTPIEICRERNSSRSRVVPAYVIDKQLRQFEVPYENEGWDKIKIINCPTSNPDLQWKELRNKVSDFGSQNNKHHSLSLYDHCCMAGRLAYNLHYPLDVVEASYVHDFGKIFTGVKWPDKDDDMHYPNHANVGAYLALNMGYSLRVAQLVCYHMIFYMDSRAQSTWHLRLGEEIWKGLKLLHSTDEAAH